MPLTPFHFGPNALAAWPARRQLDLPAVLLANIAIDIEPLVITLLGTATQPHGYAHTLLGATVIGTIAGAGWWWGVREASRRWDLDYFLGARVAVVSAVIGGWLHVLLDSVMYSHLRPLFPLAINPFHVPGSGDLVHVLAAAAFALLAALIYRTRFWRTTQQRATVLLLTIAAVTAVIAFLAGVT